jgi:hypothetical protein
LIGAAALPRRRGKKRSLILEMKGEKTMIRVERIPILAARLEEAEKKKRLKARRAERKASRLARSVDRGWLPQVLWFDSAGHQIIQNEESSKRIAKERI